MTLSKRDAKLRAEALYGIGSAVETLDGREMVWSALGAVLYNRKTTALRRIERAEEHLRKAKRALREWGKP